MQKDDFLAGEGDQYYRRNIEANRKNHERALANPAADPVIGALIDIKPASVLEVGTGNGWRLDVMRRLWGASCIGIDPSAEAIASGFPDVTLIQGTADKLPDCRVEAVVFGYCLYLCDRADLFRIAAEADRVLLTGGHVVVYDFCTTRAYANEYRHKAGVYSYKMDYSRMWTWHPGYVLWTHKVVPFLNENPDVEDNRLAVSVIKKLT